MKKKVRKFGSGGMPPIGDSVASGNRVARQEGAEMRKMGVGAKKRTGMPPIGESVKSGNRMSKENAKDLRAVSKYAKGGKVKKRYDDGGEVSDMGRAGLDLEAQARRGETLRELDRMDTSVPKVSAPVSKPKAAAPKPKPKPKLKPAAQKPVDGGEDEEITVTAKRLSPSAASTPTERPWYRRPLTDAEKKEEASKKRVPAPSETKGYASRGARNIAERTARVAKNTATEKARVSKPNIFKRLYDMTVNPGVDMKYAKGGKVTRADGIARKGKTKGKMV